MAEAQVKSAASPLKMVREFFGLSMTEMKTEWVPMSEADKADIIKGLSDGTLSY